MPVGGQLKLKGGVALKKKKEKKPKKIHLEEPEGQQAEDDKAAGAVAKVAQGAINVMTGKNYEQEFELEQQRMAQPKVKTTPWGSTYRPAPEILHGYSRKVTGDTPSERLDMRAATKADKFCK